MDIGTAAVIFQLQVEKSNEVFRSFEGNGKGREGVFSDSQIAFQMYMKDMEHNIAIVADRKMSSSIARACQMDGDVLVESLSEEQAAAGDRDFACRLGGVAAHCPLPPWTVGSEFLDDEILEKLRALYVTAPVEETSSEGQLSSAWAATRGPQKHTKRYCTACQEQTVFFDLARAPCGHEYCRDCLRELFLASLGDDSLFPPRCCRQSIATGSKQKKVEFETSDRTYCSNPLCSAFIRVENIANEQASCQNCLTITCTVCKANHTGDCPEDVGLQQNCRRVVELDIGCNHITCTCNAEFCYVCGQRWKICACVQWNEDRLLARANHIVARRPARFDPPEQQARIAAVIQNLRDRHNCDHETWQYVRGRHQCEECRDTLPSYIFECQRCNIQACNRCRRNRL
ncbi:IBR finger domain protein [Hyaloscypha variabilis]